MDTNHPSGSNANPGRPERGVAPIGQPANSARRRLFRGAAAAPVILTFTSRPVLGFEQACLSPSRMISGNHSGLTGVEPCGGTSLTTYYSQAKETGKPLDWTTFNFAAIFGVAYTKSGASGSSSPDKFGPIFIDSYEGNDGNSNVPTGSKFAAYIIAAYLNALPEGRVRDVLTPPQVIHMWNDIVAPTSAKPGLYCPQIAMCWDANGVIGYLHNSGIVPS